MTETGDRQPYDWAKESSTVRDRVSTWWSEASTAKKAGVGALGVALVSAVGLNIESAQILNKLEKQPKDTVPSGMVRNNEGSVVPIQEHLKENKRSLQPSFSSIPPNMPPLKGKL